MFIVIVKRVVKQKDFVQSVSYHLVGPFRKQIAAERAVLRLSGVFTTLEATVHSYEQICTDFARSTGFFQREERDAIERAKKAMDGVLLATKKREEAV